MKHIPISSEADWIRRAQQGDNKAFQLLVEQYAQTVRKTVIGMLGEGGVAEDVAQEVFIRLHKALPKFRGEAQLSTYIHRIAVNLSLTELKKQQRRRKWQLPFNRETTVQTNRITEEDQQARKDLKDVIDLALQQIDPDFRAVVVLRLVQGYSLKETAHILNIPEGTVASRLARGQKKLQQILRNHR